MDFRMISWVSTCHRPQHGLYGQNRPQTSSGISAIEQATDTIITIMALGGVQTKGINKVSGAKWIKDTNMVPGSSPWTSTWPQVAVEITHFNIVPNSSMAHRHQHGIRWQQRPQISEWPSVVTQATNINTVPCWGKTIDLGMTHRCRSIFIALN